MSKPATSKRFVRFPRFSPVKLGARGARYAIEPLERRILMAAGDFDNSYGTFGQSITSFPSQLPFAFVVDSALQPDNKVVILGIDSGGANFLARFDATGTPDSTFGSGGLVLSGVGTTPASGLALQSDGGIIVAGDNGSFITVRRFDPNGSPDNAFGTGGVANLATGVNFSETAADVLVRPDNRIVVGGTTTITSGGPTDFILFGLTAAGLPDSNFGNSSSYVETNLGTTDTLEALGLLSDGRVVATGRSPVLGLALYTATGAPDTSFNGTGEELFGSFNENAGSVAIGLDNKILAATTATNNNSSVSIVRFNTDGTIDSTFGSAGIVDTAAKGDPFGGSLRVDPAGLIVGAFDVPDSQNEQTVAVNIVRYNSNGTLDTSFANAGTQMLTQTGITTNAVLFQADQKVMIVASAPDSSANTSFILARLDDASTPTPTPTPTVATTDLVFARTSFAAGGYHAGDSISANIATARTGSTSPITADVATFLSTDNVLGNADDIPLTSGSVVAGVSTQGTPTATLGQIPAGTAPGSYFVIEQLDPLNVVAESDETNNVFVSKTAAITVDVALPPLPTLASGAVDPTFGTAGIVRQQIGFEQTTGLVQQSDGKIIVSGFGGGVGARNAGVSRRLADGSADPAFNAGGSNFFDVRSTAQVGAASTDDVVADIKLQADGKIVIVGTTDEVVGGVTVGSDFFIARLTADGVLDPSFNGTGIIVTDFSSDSAGHPSTDIARNVIVMNDGRIVVAGRSDASGSGTDFAIARYNADGTLDGTFNSGGKALIDLAGGSDGAQAVKEAAFGALVVAGYAGQGANRALAVIQLTALGSLDTKFGNGGRIVFSAGGTDERLNAIDIGAQGTIVVAGSSGTGSTASGNYASDFIAARFSSKGKLDTKFGVAGIGRASFGQPTNATSLRVASDGGVLVSGVTSAGVALGNADRYDLALALFRSTGVLDTTFSDDGKVIIPTTASSSAAPSLQHAIILRPFAGGAAADALDAFQNAAEGKLADRQGGGALIAGTNGDQTVIAAVVTSGIELSGALIAKFPVSIIGGAKGTATISVTDLGDLSANGLIDIDLFTSTDQTLGSGDRKFFTLANQKLSLKPLTDKGKPKAFKAKFAFPTDLLDGTYYLLAEVNSQRTITELNPNNNTAFTTQTLQIAAPFVDLTGPGLPGGNTLVEGKPLTLPITLQNIGNTAVAGTAVFNFVLSLDTTLDGSDTTLTPAAVKVALKANQTKPTKVKIVVPTIAPNSYYLFVTVNPGNTLQERTIANNLLVTAIPAVVK